MSEEGGGIYRATFNFFDLAKYGFLIIVLLALCVALIGWPVPIKGESMLPNLNSGEVVIVEMVSYFNDRPIRRGDVVAARFPADPSHTRLIKRVVGLPGEKIAISAGKIEVNGQLLDEDYQPIIATPPYQEISGVVLGPDEYFLAGDNRPGSSDSRLWGPVVRQDILGRAAYVIYPFKEAKFIPRGEN